MNGKTQIRTCWGEAVEPEVKRGAPTQRKVWGNGEMKNTQRYWE